MDNKNILIVDDDEQILEMLTEILDEEDLEADQCSSGEEAISKLSDVRYKLVISDVRMPGMSGFDLLEFIKDRYEDTRVILMTGYTDDYDISDALILGADDYITKPFDIDKVVLSVKNSLSI